MRIQVICGVMVCLVGLESEALAVCSVPTFEEAQYDGHGQFNNQPDAPYTNGWGRSGDFEYQTKICTQKFSNDMWWAYDFDQGDWDNGRGYENFCDITKMLGRTYTALWMLNYSESSANQASTWDDVSGNPLRWAGNYAHLSFDELDASCSWSDDNAHTVWGPVIDNYTTLYKGFVYGQGVSTRAGVLLHESRHADWVPHNGNDGSPRCPAGGTSCDEKFTWTDEPGGDVFSQERDAGANSYEVWYENDFYRRASYTTTWHKQMAKDRGNWVLGNRFDSIPTFRI